MGKRKIRFIVNGISLFEDKIITEEDGFPVLFACKDMFSFYYVAFCIDKENKKYIIVKPSLIDVYHLISGKITFDVLANSCDVFWIIQEGDNEDCQEDVIDCYSIKEIDKYL